jgi:N-acetyl-gamma-glutamyl-phosphate reductase
MPEIEQTLGLGSTITFVPHLLPVNRGILVTAYADLKKKISTAELLKAYSDFYEGEPFVHVLPEGQFPELQSVQRSNFCQLGLRVDARHGRAIVLGVIDNLGKGASGQAVQNLNLMFGFKETEGLA